MDRDGGVLARPATCCAKKVPGAGTGDFLGAACGGAGENTTVPVHPAVMSPLLVWALRTVTEFGPDILAAWRETRRLLDCIPSAARPGGVDDLRNYLQDLSETGQPLPVFTGAQAEALSKAHQVMATRAGEHGQGLPGFAQVLQV